MKWGIGLYTGQVPADAEHTTRDEYRFIVEQAQLAERLGIDSLWLSEHHGAEDGYLPSLLPLAAAILTATERLVVGTAVMLAPFHNPIRLAEDVAVIDQLSGGRFILGTGPAGENASSAVSDSIRGGGDLRWRSPYPSCARLGQGSGLTTAARCTTSGTS